MTNRPHRPTSPAGASVPGDRRVGDQPAERGAMRGSSEAGRGESGQSDGGRRGQKQAWVDKTVAMGVVGMVAFTAGVLVGTKVNKPEHPNDDASANHAGGDGAKSDAVQTEPTPLDWMVAGSEGGSANQGSDAGKSPVQANKANTSQTPSLSASNQTPNSGGASGGNPDVAAWGSGSQGGQASGRDATTAGAGDASGDTSTPAAPATTADGQTPSQSGPGTTQPADHLADGSNWPTPSTWPNGSLDGSLGGSLNGQPAAPWEAQPWQTDPQLWGQVPWRSDGPLAGQNPVGPNRLQPNVPPTAGLNQLARIGERLSLVVALADVSRLPAELDGFVGPTQPTKPAPSTGVNPADPARPNGLGSTNNPAQPPLAGASGTDANGLANAGDGNATPGTPTAPSMNTASRTGLMAAWQSETDAMRAVSKSVSAWSSKLADSPTFVGLRLQEEATPTNPPVGPAQPGRGTPSASGSESSTLPSAPDALDPSNAAMGPNAALWLVLGLSDQVAANAQGLSDALGTARSAVADVQVQWRAIQNVPTEEGVVRLGRRVALAEQAFRAVLTQGKLAERRLSQTRTAVESLAVTLRRVNTGAYAESASALAERVVDPVKLRLDANLQGLVHARGRLEADVNALNRALELFDPAGLPQEPTVSLAEPTRSGGGKVRQDHVGSGAFDGQK